jgi:NTE family protein
MATIDTPDDGLARSRLPLWPRLRQRLPRLFTGDATILGSLRGRGINLALQGGGAFGAFTWGVLDRLLEEDSFRPASASGASAGALNAAVMATGYLKSGPEGARDALGSFWAAVAQSTSLAYWASPLLWSKGGFSKKSNPLADIVKSSVDVRRLRKQAPFPLYIAATNARSFKTRIFTEADLSHDALLASACLPQIHDTVWINREPYWDGGLSANPPILPLVEAGHAGRTLLIKLLPSGIGASGDPTRDVAAGLRLAAFARPLETDLERLEHLQVLGRQSSGPMPKILSRAASHRLDVIDGASALSAQNRESLPTPALVRQLRDAGRQAAEAWLKDVPATASR